jgi:endonuclease/exonuclease/phosphatase (EEP) superfamily protein YafD
LLLLGDFNLVGDSPLLATLLREGRLQATAVAPEHTHAAGAVDHVFARDLACGPARVPATGGTSDHRPVVVPFAAGRAR